ncbi:MAG: response regulator [Burkholderiales bacterium]|nr:response regulator [Phycisphaerae bacterium]
MTMRLLKDLPIRRKLMLITTVISGVALVVACAAFATYDYITFRSIIVKDLTTSADVIGANCTAAIQFADRESANEALSSLHLDRSIMSASISDRTGAELADYRRKGVADSAWINKVMVGSPQIGTDSMVVARAIMLDQKPIGTIRICSDLSRLYDRIRTYAAALLVVLVAGLSASLLVVSRLQGVITTPILSLAQTARDIAENSNYSARAVKTGTDELGTLVDCFNGMLEQIELQNTQLAAHRDHLEDEVARRTEELSTTNTQLSAARDRAEAANRAKSDFLANMSHEIRTPMTAILGYADLMLSPQQTMSDRIDCLQVVRRNARHLMDLINDVLDISKIEADKMTVEKIPCDIAQTAVEVVSMLRPRAMIKNLTLTVDFVGPIPVEVRTDPTRLKQVLMNLTANAIKFTDRGDIRLKVSVEKVDGADRARFDITDSGIGMTPEQLAKLFKPFVQADESMTRKYGGTGLGLVISKRLANYMGGDVAVQSEYGKRSTFTVWVDAGSLDGATMREGLSESVLGIATHPADSEQIALSGRILLAEDGIDNQRLLMMHLSMAGADVVLAENGRIALERVQSEPFDVVLMDMQMPELDGYGATSELRRRGFTLPIIALTAHAMSGDRAKCIEAGCTDYLTKPIDRELLLRTVSGYLQTIQRERLRAANGGIDPVSVLTPEPPHPQRTPPEQIAPQRLPKPARVITSSGGRTCAVAMAMKKATQGFVERLPERVNSLISQISQGQMDDLRRTVHQLKGAGTGYGFPLITETAAKAEAMIKASAQCDEIRAGIDELVAIIRQVEGYNIAVEKNDKSEVVDH